MYALMYTHTHKCMYVYIYIYIYICIYIYIYAKNRETEVAYFVIRMLCSVLLVVYMNMTEQIKISIRVNLFFKHYAQNKKSWRTK